MTIDRLIGRVLGRREVPGADRRVAASAVAAVGLAPVGRVRRRDVRCVDRGATATPVATATAAAVAELAAIVRRRPRADRGAVLRRREARPLRHPHRHRRPARSPTARSLTARLGRLAGRRQRVRAARGRARRRLALRRRRRLLRRRAANRATTSCAATSTPTRTGGAASRRSTPAGTRVARSTSTSRSGPIRRASSGFEFTSQLFFDDAFSDTVYATGVYAAKGTPDVRERATTASTSRARG